MKVEHPASSKVSTFPASAHHIGKVKGANKRGAAPVNQIHVEMEAPAKKTNRPEATSASADLDSLEIFAKLLQTLVNQILV